MREYVIDNYDTTNEEEGSTMPQSLMDDHNSAVTGGAILEMKVELVATARK
jgi:hypothetical protein